MVLGVIAILARRQERMWLTQQLTSEVQDGLLSQEEYDILRSHRRRLGDWWEIMRDGGWRAFRTRRRLFRLATELAFAKHRLERSSTERRDVEHRGQERVEKLREEMRSLRRRA